MIKIFTVISSKYIESKYELYPIFSEILKYIPRFSILKIYFLSILYQD